MVPLGNRRQFLSNCDSSQGCDFVPYSSSEFGSSTTPDLKPLPDWEIEAALRSLRGQLLELEFEWGLRRCNARGSGGSAIASSSLTGLRKAISCQLASAEAWDKENLAVAAGQGQRKDVER